MGSWLWFKFILGLNFISLCFKLNIILYHTPKQRELTSKSMIKLNQNIYTSSSEFSYTIIGLCQNQTGQACMEKLK